MSANSLSVVEGRELAQLEGVIAVALPAVERGQSAILEVGAALYEIKAKQLYRAFGNLDEYCKDRWGFTGTRGSQWAEGYAVYREIGASRPGGWRGTEALEFMTGFTESHARAMRALSPPERVAAWEAAKEEEELPTAALLARIAARFGKSPEEVASMTRQEQEQLFGDLRAAVQEARQVEEAAEAARMAVKRNRKVIAEMKRPELAGYFDGGEYHVTGGITGLAETLLRECDRVREELAMPLLKTAGEKLAEALSEANADAVA